MASIKINSQEELDKMINENDGCLLDTFIFLGFARSSKEISFTGDGDYYIYHEIDDTEEVVKHDKLADTNIGQAIKEGRFYKYNYN